MSSLMEWLQSEAGSVAKDFAVDFKQHLVRLPIGGKLVRLAGRLIVIGGDTLVLRSEHYSCDIVISLENVVKVEFVSKGFDSRNNETFKVVAVWIPTGAPYFKVEHRTAGEPQHEEQPTYVAGGKAVYDEERCGLVVNCGCVQSMQCAP